jgi:rhodanese-related sulfurtransferase
MTTIPRKHLFVVNMLALAVCMGVLLAYWMAFEQVPTITVEQASAMLAKPDSALLVDVRPADVFARHHLPEAVSWPLQEIEQARDTSGLAVEIKQRKVLVLCETGISSAMAVRKLKSLGVDAWNIQGGMVAWTLAPAATTNGAPKAGPVSDVRPMSVFKQWTVVITAFGIKPIYLLVSLALILWLWRRTEPDLVALCWGLVWFWCGEQACSANFLAYAGRSELLEYLHNFGMVAGFAFVNWAAMEGIDRRILHFGSEKDRCALLSLCRRCIKYDQAACGLRRLFLFTIPAAAVMACLPLMADFRLTAYQSDILGASVCYSHTAPSQIFEIRLCPILALVLFAAAWLVLLLKRHDPLPLSKVLFSAGLGALGFSLVRLFLVAVFSDDLMWFETWEEWTELLFVLGVAVVLWIFRAGLRTHSPQAATATPPATT